jgi:aminobenzoyl-glutamate utilization protein B
MITLHKLLCFLIALFLATQNAIAQDLRTSLMQSISQREESSWSMAQKIWDFAEPGYLEKQSSNLIANALNKEGFIIAKGIAGIPTAFSATLGSGKPVIAMHFLKSLKRLSPFANLKKVAMATVRPAGIIYLG